MAPKRILFIHPDLGIGGAERLVVDAAVGLQDQGHRVSVYTSHCDTSHCFDEARDGTLSVHIAGNSIVPSSLFGRFSILCACLRQIHLALTLMVTGQLWEYDYVFIDQLSVCIPVLRLAAPELKILFYCHFPDYLLAQRGSAVKRLYRIPFDWVEGFTTGLAHAIVVNSKFTRSVFKTAFPRIEKVPRVVSPCVDVASASKEMGKDTLLDVGGKQLVLSINRFERKKNIELAVSAYGLLGEAEKSKSVLVVAGGWDSRVRENQDYHAELASLCDSQKLQHVTISDFGAPPIIPAKTNVVFLLSIPAAWKTNLLQVASLLAYTPEREHFGIVPLEAMLAETPVLAHTSGGPLETVDEGKTGWLRPDVPSEWMAVIKKALFEMDEGEREAMGKAGKERVVREFSKEKMAERIENELERIEGNGLGGLVIVGLVMAVLVLGIAAGIAAGKMGGFY